LHRTGVLAGGQAEQRQEAVSSSQGNLPFRWVGGREDLPLLGTTCVDRGLEHDILGGGGQEIVEPRKRGGGRKKKKEEERRGEEERRKRKH
jgi:hypothetical protein